MKGRIVPAIMLTLLLTSMLTFAFNVQRVRANAPDISFQPLSEPPPTEWTQAYGDADEQHAYSVVQTGDGGYALAGETVSYGGGGPDFWLVRTDSSGNTLWSKIYGGSGGQIAYSMIQTSDGGYALAGYTSATFNFLYDFLLVKTDAAGNQLWSRTYGGSQNDVAFSVVQTSDGGYAVAGVTNIYSGSGGEDFWLVKTDPSGNMMWNRTYGGANGDEAYSVVQTADAGYAIAGYTASYGVDGDFWLVKTDSYGSMMWSKNYGNIGGQGCGSLVLTSDGGYALAGATQYPTEGYLLVKTDSSGNLLWSKTYAAQTPYERCSLIRTTDGGYGLAARIGFDDPNFLFLKTDAAGNTMWDATYGGTAADGALSVIQTSDGGYAIAGYTCSYGAGRVDFWLVKVSATSPPAGPQITGIDPSQPIAGGGKQLLSVLGEGFVLNSEVDLTIGSDKYRIPSGRNLFISPNRIEIIAGLTEGLWKASVTNPGGIQSNEYAFQVRGVSIEDGKKVLELALQYTKPPYEWTIEDATKMAAIAGPESGWRANAAFDEGNYPVNYIGQESWGLWQIFMMWHLDKLAKLGAPIDPPYYQTAKWLLDPKNNVKAAYEVWHEAKGFKPGATGFEPWTGYTSGKWKLEPWYGVFRVKASVYKCPVNVTIADNYGRVISEIENQIPGASFVYFNDTDTKIFYLPLNLTYQVQLNATNYGNCTIGQITPTESIYETAFSQMTFNLTSETVAEFDLAQYDANYTLKVDENGDGLIDYELAPEVGTITTEYDIGITESVPSKTIIGEGYDIPINTTVMNYGAYTETFNVTVYANATFIDQTEVTLTSGNSTTITFTWNTTGFALGNYTISAAAEILPGETDTTDNNFPDGWVFVSIPGDINGDQYVNAKDAVLLGAAFNSNQGQPSYNPNADINEDEWCNAKDAVILGTHFNEHW